MKILTTSKTILLAMSIAGLASCTTEEVVEVVEPQQDLVGITIAPQCETTAGQVGLCVSPEERDRVLDGIIFNEPCNYVSVHLPDGTTSAGFFKSSGGRCDQ